MSYILDALNKSERERTENKTPGLNTVHQRADRQETKTPQRWLIVFTFILSLNLVVLAIWYFTDLISPEHQTNVAPRSKPSVSVVIQDPIFSNQAFDRPKNSIERKRPIYEEQKASTDPLSPTGQMRLSEGPPPGSESRSARVDALDQLAAIRFLFAHICRRSRLANGGSGWPAYRRRRHSERWNSFRADHRDRRHIRVSGKAFPNRRIKSMG